MKRIFILACLLLLNVPAVFPRQESDSTQALTLREVIEIAQRQSPDVLYARHSFRSSYWNYCYYKANYLPSLSFSSTPNFNHIINAITLPDGTSEYVQQNQLTTDAALSINQNIPLTGGSLSVQTSLQRLDLLDDESYSYKSTPVIVAYSQSLFGYNQLKWDKKIEPLRFEEAKRNYVEALELVAAKATTKFFNLAKAQTNLEIAHTNYANADTLYTFAQGRYDIGTITENEMLQLEINKLTEETNRLNAQLEVDDCREDLRSFLGIDASLPIVAKVNEETALAFIDTERALQYAVANSADVLYIERRKMESESSVAIAKANAGLRADLFLQFGLAQTGRDMEAAYRKPNNQQYVEVGLRLPILDWGRGKGQVQVARSNRNMVHAQMDQDRNTFEMNLIKTVKQFNLQTNQLKVAAKADYTAGRRNDVARKLYLLGKVNILDLNASISEKDAAKRNYITTLSNYWILYYTLRSLTLFDFEKNIPITEDYQLLIK